MIKAYGRPRVLEEKLSDLLSVPVTPAMRSALASEARRYGYRSVAAYIREHKLFASVRTKEAIAQ